MESGESVLLLASIGPVQANQASKNTVFRIVIDGTDVVGKANTAGSNGWSYRSPSIHAVATGLSAGEHTAELQYKTQSGSVKTEYYVAEVGEGYLGLTAECAPASQIETSVLWPTSMLSGTSTAWASMPGGTRSVTFTISSSNDKVLILADIGSAQNTVSTTNNYFRMIVDGSVQIGNWDTGYSQGWGYDTISFHGVATGLSVGDHTAELQYKVREGGINRAASFRMLPCRDMLDPPPLT